MKLLLLLLIIFMMGVSIFVPVTTSRAAEPDVLTGTQWRLVSFGDADTETAVIEDSEVTIVFEEDGQVNGSGGCNSFGSTYEVDGDTIAFALIISTKMACADAGIMEQEQAYFDALQAAKRYEMLSGQLIIEYGDEQRLVFAPLLGLRDAQWQLVSYGDVDGLTSVIEGSLVTIEFDEENNVAGAGGCNSYAGNYETNVDAISIGQIVSTEIACLDDALMTQERAYYEALQAAVRYEISGEQLIIEYGEGQQLVFMRVNSLSGSQWQLVSYGEADIQTPVIGDSVVTLVFGEDNQVGGFSGCNSYGGTYEVAADTLAVKEIVSTLMACMADGIMEQEQVYFTALQSVTRYETTGDMLTLEYGEGQKLIFTRQNQ